MIPSSCSIVIPTYNRADLLPGALNSIQQLVVPAGWHVEIIVVDNASTDRTAEVVDEFRRDGPIKVQYIVEAQQGLNHARNRALLEADSDWIIYLDDDIRVNTGWLAGFADAVEKHAPDCVIGPVEPWFEQAPDAWLTPRVVESVTSAYSQKGDSLHVVEENRAHQLPGCNFAVRRTVALEAGGFHPSLDRSGNRMLAGGDVEFGVRIVRLGKRVVYVPRCSIGHFISTKKISVGGLRVRWKGLGVTRRALHRLDGTKPSRLRLIRDYLRMFRLSVRSLVMRLLGRKGEGFEAELRALYLWGYLVESPPLEPRPWPPIPLRLDGLEKCRIPIVTQRTRMQAGSR